MPLPIVSTLEAQRLGQAVRSCVAGGARVRAPIRPSAPRRVGIWGKDGAGV